VLLGGYCVPHVTQMNAVKRFTYVLS